MNRSDSNVSAGWVDVALPVPLDQAFTYAVPVGVRIATGMRVRVPWGRRTLIGVVVAEHRRLPEGIESASLRAVDRVLDDEPILDDVLLEMARWTADYYQAPLGEAVRCALPPPAEVKERRRLRVTEEGVRLLTAPTPMLFAASPHPENDTQASLREMLETIADGMARSTVQARFGAAAIRNALRQGWLAEESEVSTQVAARVETAYRLTGKEPVAATWRRPEQSGRPLPAIEARPQRPTGAASKSEAVVPHPVGRRTPQQLAILDQLRTAGGSLTATRLQQVSYSALQTLIKRGEVERFDVEAAPLPPDWTPRPRVESLNPDQMRVFHDVMARVRHRIAPAPAPAQAVDDRGVVLLHGVTGSGKTAIYIEAIQATLDLGRSALLLVPEIGLTPAVFADFEAAFPGQVAVLHSGLSAAERAQHWHRARRGEARVVIGTRSAIFAPVPGLALIIVDEEHDASYKQQESPRYHARDLAVLRGKLANAVVLLGSATPSLESYAHATTGKYVLLTMLRRVQKRPLPAIRLVDMSEEFRRSVGRNQRATGEDAPISTDLTTAIQDRLDRGEQVILLINRRGYSPVVLCRSCGKTVGCRDCDLSLTYHKRVQRLVCHVCGYDREVPDQCPSCGSEYIYFLGAGSEKVEERLGGLFPRARITRLDRDTARGRRQFAAILGAFRNGEYDLLVGTQMIAKGHDMPGVTLVGVINADLGLTIPEFRSAERTYQLLTQVAGRAGRGELPGEVILQVLHPEHYAVQAALANDYGAFYEKEARFRQWMHYPPFAALASIQIRHTEQERVLQMTSQIGRLLEKLVPPDASGLRVLGPAPAPVARIKTEFRYQFLLKGSSRRRLSHILRATRNFVREQKYPATALVIDVDPLTLG